MYELTPLFWYKFQFVAEIIVAEAILFFYCKKKSRFKLRVTICFILSMLLAFALPVLGYNATYSTIMFFALFGITVIMLKQCFDERNFIIIFLAVSAYAVQHIAYRVFELLVLVTNANGGEALNTYMPEGGNVVLNPFVYMLYTVTYLAVYGMSYLFISKKYLKHVEVLEIKRLPLFFIAFLIFIAAIILNSFVVYFDNLTTANKIIYFVYDIISCLLAVYIQFDVALREKLEINYNTMKHLYFQEKQQYGIMKDNINLINMKCHDLKHQVRSIARDRSLSEDAIEEIEKVISIYDANVKTGNEAMDIILTEKSFFCKENNIELSCMVDGSKLSFMPDHDIYSLFGNLIDNAIEATLKLDVGERIISLTAKATFDVLTISVYNYFKDEIKYKGSKIQTTKSDKNYHGYGIKSINHITTKYGGEMTISTDNNIFNVNIAFIIKS